MAKRKATQNKTKKQCVSRRSRRNRKLSPLRAASRNKVSKKKHPKKCPHCTQLAKKLKKPTSACRKRPELCGNYFPIFFRYICDRARKNNVKQSGCVSMIQAADCWGLLTCEQKDHFIGRVKSGEFNYLGGGGDSGSGGGTGGCNGGRASSGSSGDGGKPPPSSGCVYYDSKNFYHPPPPVSPSGSYL